MSQMVELPKTLAGCADRMKEVRDLRLAKQKEVDELAREENALEVYLVGMLPKSDASGIAGKTIRAQIETKIYAKVDDWQKFFAYVGRTGSWDMLQHRVTDKAIKARWDDGKEVPGVGHFQKSTISLRKL